MSATAARQQKYNNNVHQLNLEGVVSLPKPLTPADCDLTSFPYFSFDAAKFRDSDFALTVDPAAGFRAVMLWSAAWHQIPAASLPNNDKILFRLSGCMSMDEWLSVKEEAMYGFILCSDGRYYHKHLAEHANKAWEKSRKAKAAVAARKDRQPKPKPTNNNQKTHVEQSFNDDSTNVDTNVSTDVLLGEGEERRGKDNTPPLPPIPDGKEIPVDEIDIAKLEKPMPLQKGWMQDPRIKQAFRDVMEDYGLEATELIWKFIAGGFVDYWTGLDPKTKKAKKVDWVATFRNWARKAANDNQWRWKKDQQSCKSDSGSGHKQPDYYKSQPMATAEQAQSFRESLAGLLDGDAK